MVLRVSELTVYPVKSLPGVRLDSVRVNARGLGLDRRWMLVDENREMVTQRAEPMLSQIGVRLDGENLSLNIGGEECPVPSAAGQARDVQVWGDTVSALPVSTEISQKISALLKKNLELVWMPEQTRRSVESHPGTQEKIVGFADGFPFLVISQASLDDLNRRLKQSVGMKRFRPNIVVSNAAAFEEDEWKRFQVGELEFTHVKPCARCVMTTVNPEDGSRGSEPLKTLSSFRKLGKEVFFGQNAVHSGEGFLRVGDPVKVLERQGALI